MSKIAFKGGLLIDGVSREAVENSLVLIADGKIAYAGSNKEVPQGYESANKKSIGQIKKMWRGKMSITKKRPRNALAAMQSGLKVLL